MAWTSLAASADLALSILIQTTVLLGVGLLAGWTLRRAGAAVQSACYRTTLATVLFCPVLVILLTAAGWDRSKIPTFGWLLVGSETRGTGASLAPWPTFSVPELPSPSGLWTSMTARLSHSGLRPSAWTCRATIRA